MVTENTITLSTYREAYANDFKEINLQWIRQFFEVEEHDLEQLSNPKEYIIDKGGEIVFAIEDDKVLGVCALLKTGEREYELAKMGVTPEAQGKHIGYRLGSFALSIARERGAVKVWLESNRILKPALHLYEKLGFKEVPVTYTPYARADIKMEVNYE